MKLNPNKERHRTRDLLLKYDSTFAPCTPSTIEMTVVYPWENLQLNTLKNQLYSIAVESGYIGTEEHFLNNFGYYLSHQHIVFAKFIDFPVIGETDKLYFDLEEKILYYWNNEYIPVNAMLIANTTLEGGGA